MLLRNFEEEQAVAPPPAAAAAATHSKKRKKGAGAADATMAFDAAADVARIIASLVSGDHDDGDDFDDGEASSGSRNDDGEDDDGDGDDNSAAEDGMEEMEEEVEESGTLDAQRELRVKYVRPSRAKIPGCPRRRVRKCGVRSHWMQGYRCSP